VVYRADDLNLNRVVALKTLLPEYAEYHEIRLRFVLEGQAQAKVEHKHVLPVYEAGDADGVAYIAMRLVNGHDFAEQLKREGAVESRLALNYMRQISKALDYAHRAGLVHRDLKPANILVEMRDRASGRQKPHLYLADFGLARDFARPQFTRTGIDIGTPMYMAPEQHDGQRVGAPADIYAFTLILYEALSGAMPMGGRLGWAGLRPLRGPAAPLNPILARGLAVQPEQRWGSAGDVIAACEQALTPGPPRTVRLHPNTGPPRIRAGDPAFTVAPQQPSPPQIRYAGQEAPAPAEGGRRRRHFTPGSRVRIRVWAGSIKPEETGLPFAVHADRGRTGTVLGYDLQGLVQVRWDPQEWSKAGRLGRKGQKVMLRSFDSTINKDWLGNQ